MTGRPRLAMAVPHGLSYVESALLGISDYARSQGGWSFTRMPEGLGTSLEWLKRWSGDGAFVTLVDDEGVELVKSLTYPVVNLSGYLEATGVPIVCVDHEAIGRQAAEHLAGKKFRRFGYYGASRYWYSRLRCKGFREVVGRVGGTCTVLDVDSGIDVPGPMDQQLQLDRWISAMQPPVGVMASTDVRASMVIEACRQMRLRVPEDVAVIGVDNDPVFAALTEPTLTSISRNSREVGWRAAELMRNLFGQPVAPRKPIFIEPGGVIERGSTKTLAIDDPVVAEIVRYIREHVSEKFGVERLLGLFSLSRRTLEYRFRAELNTSPYDFINGQRVEAAKTKLKESPTEKTTSVAAACGFADERRLRLVFQRVTGMTPAAYRASLKAG